MAFWFSQNLRIQHAGGTIMLDQAQLQQIAQAAAAATGNTFERGIPITISTQGTAGAGSITVNTQQSQQTGRGGQHQVTDNQGGDFSGIPNLFC